MTKPKSYLSNHVTPQEAEDIINKGLELFYEQWRHKKMAEVEHNTFRAIRMTDLKLLEFYAYRNAQRGLYEDAQRGFKTMEHLKKVYRI